MTNPWPDLVQKFGPRCVIGNTTTDAEFLAETQRQSSVVFPLIGAQMDGSEKVALDFGCGAGRFTRQLHGLLPASSVTIGFDPCRELLAHHPTAPEISWHTGAPCWFFRRNAEMFNLILVAMTLGAPNIDLSATAEGIVGMLAPGGLLCVLDHMDPPVDAPPRWWEWRSTDEYADLFGSLGVRLQIIGKDRQLDRKTVLMCGRKAGLTPQPL